MDNVTLIREQYAEQLAESYQRSADALHVCALDWAKRLNFHEADAAQKRAEFFEYIARDLRQPKEIRLSLEAQFGGLDGRR